MFSLGLCQYPGCRNLAISRFDENGNISVNTEAFCIDHDKEAEETVHKIYKYIETHDKIIGISMPGIHFKNIDLSGKKFYGCDLRNCIFSAIHSEYCRMRMTMLDFSLFSDSNLLNSNMQFTSFSGCTFSHVLFTNSDLVHNNFNGITAQQSSFDDSDLYNSRFIRAKLLNTSVRNCNIKQSSFYEATFDNVSFKHSNTREANFSQGVEP
ncbi:MAG: pentapeptide repeat-containing protein [Treponema sp.]|mgnify:CR=1 FL=1|jgi:hypothetical protein|nr:pentapeptide repeat-containing protein [Treponema sp.]